MLEEEMKFQKFKKMSKGAEVKGKMRLSLYVISAFGFFIQPQRSEEGTCPFGRVLSERP